MSLKSVCDCGLMKRRSRAPAPMASLPWQVEQNCAASDLPALPADTMKAVQNIYDSRIRGLVHARW